MSPTWRPGWPRHRCDDCGFPLLVAAACLAAEAPAAADTYTVTTEQDRNRGACAASCSLREAVYAANAHAGLDTVAFALTGARVIQMTGPPSGEFDPNQSVISTGPLTVDGTTQSGYVDRPRVTVRGVGGPSGQAVLALQGGGTVRGLALVGGPNGDCLQVAGTTLVEANHIGIDAAGTATDGCGFGLRAYAVPSGTSTVTAVGNLISGNVYGFYGAGSPSTPVVARLRGNRVGTDVTGTAPRPNVEGVFTQNLQDALIGGTAPGDANLIAFNQGAGVRVGSPSTRVLQ